MLLRYPGGKNRRIKRLLNLAPLDYDEFRSPFCGACPEVFEVSSLKQRWINDSFSPLINFFLALQGDSTFIRRVLALKRRCIDAATIEQEFDKARKRLDPASYLLVNRFAVGPYIMPTGRNNIAQLSFGHLRNGWNPIRKDTLEQARETLQGVEITCQDFAPVIEAPGDDVFMFIDPPYLISSPVYDHFLTVDQHQELAMMLRRTPHRFLLTINDCPLARELYSSPRFSTYSTTMDDPAAKSAVAYFNKATLPTKKELWVMNYQ